MNEMIKNVIETMHQTIDATTAINIEAQKIRMDRLFNLYSEINSLLIKPKEHLEMEPPAEENKIKSISNQTINNLVIQHDAENKTLVSLMERDLLGGTVKATHGFSVRVPEKIIRDRGYRHGDIIKCDYKDEQNIIYEKIGDSTTEHLSKRGMIQHALISEGEDGELIAENCFIGGEVKPIYIKNAKVSPFRITDHDRDKFKLQEGDVIDIAYFQNYIQSYKIVWKHRSK